MFVFIAIELLLCIFYLTSMSDQIRLPSVYVSCWHWKCFAGNTWHCSMPTEWTEKSIASNVLLWLWIVRGAQNPIQVNLVRVQRKSPPISGLILDITLSHSQNICPSWLHLQFMAVIKWNTILMYCALLPNLISVSKCMHFGFVLK